MKLLILSDIHANPDCLKAIWERENDADDILCAGDLIDYGPFPSEVIEWMIDHKAKCVSGNHDRYLFEVLDYGYPRLDGPIPEDGIGWCHLNANLLQKEHIEYLASLPMWLDYRADGIQYTMGHSIREDYVVPDTAFLFDKYVGLNSTAGPSDEGKPRRLILGHIHRQEHVLLAGGREWLNPGSASYRRYDDPAKGAYYATICDGEVELKCIEYDRSRLAAELEKYRSILNESEVECGEYFFCKTEEDGPNEIF